MTDVESLAHAGDAVALAQILVATPSVNPMLESSGDGERAIAELCAGLLDTWGFDVALSEAEAGRANVLARIGGGDTRLLFNGHLDTVGVEGMTIDPFGAELGEGRLWGRGACDMKGGVAALLSAAAALGRAELDGELIVALTADEEHASVGMAALTESGLAADAAVVCEPTELAIMPAHKGFVWVEVDFQGRAAHGSRPEEGIDAIQHAGEFLAALGAYGKQLSDRPAHPLLGNGSIHAGTITGGSAPSVYPERCSLVVERRTLPDETPELVMEELGGVAERLRAELGVSIELRESLARPGTEVSEDSALVQGLMKAATEAGRTATVEGMTAWVDAAFLNEAGTPAVCFGPGSIAQAHSADEWIEVAEIEACARILVGFGASFLQADGA